MNSINHPQQGFTLLEILMALSLFSLTIYAVYSSTFITTQSTRATRLFQHAVLLSENMNLYLQSHHNNPSDYQAKWQAEIQKILPQASGALIITSNQAITKITWGGMSDQQCQESISGLKGCVITTRAIIN